MKPNISKIFQRNFQFLNKVSCPPNLHSISLLSDCHVQNKQLLEQMFQNSAEIICSDGGANHYFDFCVRNPLAVRPKVIIGDMGTILPKSQKYFDDNATEIIANSDPDSNNFEKAIQYIVANNLKDESKGIRLFCNNDFSRLDHFL